MLTRSGGGPNQSLSDEVLSNQKKESKLTLVLLLESLCEEACETGKSPSLMQPPLYRPRTESREFSPLGQEVGDAPEFSAYSEGP